MSDWVTTREALARVGPRFADMLRGVRDPTARAVGEWSIADTAAHVAVVAAADAFVARGDPEPPPALADLGEAFLGATLETLGEVNRRSLDQRPRDPAALADEVAAGVEAALDGTADRTGDEPVTWLGGVELPTIAVLAHFVMELLVHGYDIAHAERRPWPLPAEDALVAQRQFVNRLVAGPGAERFLPPPPPGTDVVAELRLGDAPPTVVSVADGWVTVLDGDVPGPDVRVSADPGLMLLVMFDRVGPVGAALRGRLRVGGRRPWRVRRLMRAMQTP